MHAKLMKMLGKKRDLPEVEKHAKMDVVRDLRNSAAAEMGHKLGSLHKATVMSDSPEGLEKGLDKAKQVVSADEEHQMKVDAEDPYSDVKHAADNHKGEEDLPQYNEGGEVDEDSDDDSDEDESPAEASEDSEFHGLDMHEIDEKLQKLMEMKRKMESSK